MNILIGLCGNSKRFLDQGYEIPKYLITFNGMTMLQHAVKTFGAKGDIHLIVLEEHLIKYPFLKKMLSGIGKIVVSPERTEGAAATLLLAKDYLHDLNRPMISINCDQYLKDWNFADFEATLKENVNTSYIVTFNSANPNYSYVRLNDDGSVVEIKEKQIISNVATTGIYHWAKTSDFIADAEEMILAGHKENNEYYVAPVYMNTINRGLPVKTYTMPPGCFWPVGTPEELNIFLENNNT